MITYYMNQCGSMPRYQYLYECIRNDIQNGALKAAEKLPSKRALAQHLSISVSTVESAYSLLVGEGYIYAKRNAGFFVCSDREKGNYDVRDYPEAEEIEPLIDFKANKCSLSLFPMNTWAKLMRQVLSDQDPMLLKTVPFNGLYALRSAIASYLYEFKGMRVSPARIIIGAGTEYLYGKLLQLFGPQTIVAIEDPGYKKFSDISNSFGTLWNYIPMDAKGMCIDYLERSKSNLVHVSPANHFPSGIVMPIKRRKELLEWAAKSRDRYIIEDDYDSELRFTGQSLPTLFSMDTQNQVIYLNTFSKTLVPSLRISYMVLPEALMALYEQGLSFYSCSVSSFEQYVLAKFIAHGHFERHINRLKRHYKRQQELVIEAIQSSSIALICHVKKSQVGTHMLLDMHTKLSDKQIHEAGKARGMELNLLSDYCYYSAPEHLSHIVLNFASLKTEEIKLLIAILEDIFREDIDMKKKL